MGKEFEKEWYNEVYQKKAKYSEHYSKTNWYPRFLECAKLIKKDERVLEVGCGTGQLAHLLFDQGKTNYKGFDFSSTAIQKCLDLDLDPMLFYVGDAYNKANYNDYDTILCCETLEHLQDFRVLDNIEKGKKIVLTVPDFKAPNHLFHIKSYSQLTERYKNHIEFSYITKIKAWYVAEGVKL